MFLHWICLPFLRWKMRGVRWLWMGRSGSILAREGAGISGMISGCKIHGFQWWVVAPCGVGRCTECRAAYMRSYAQSHPVPRKPARIERVAAEMRAKYLTGKGSGARALAIERRTVGRETRGGDEAKTA